MSADSTLLRACTILYSFRALAATEEDSQRAQFESQILHLIADLANIDNNGGFVLLARNEADLRAAARERGLDSKLLDRVCSEGAVHGAVPIYVRGAIAGVIHFDASSDLLAAVATLASSALESVREIETLQVRNALLEENIATGIVGGSPLLQKLL